MNKIEIFDPAMCCSTGVCGPSVDTELLRTATVIDNLKIKGADITRYGIATEPALFVSNAKVNELLMKDNDVLPITLLNGEVVKTKIHLSNQEFEEYTGISVGEVEINNNNCCASDTGCC